MKTTDDIQNFGLGKIGHWKLSHHRSTDHLSHMSGVDFVLENNFKKAKNVVYHFRYTGKD